MTYTPIPKTVYKSKLNILSETYTRKNLGHCYNEETYKVIVEGTHPVDTINEFGNEYIEKNQRGQVNHYDGFTVDDNNNTVLRFVHTIDSSD